MTKQKDADDGEREPHMIRFFKSEWAEVAEMAEDDKEAVSVFVRRLIREERRRRNNRKG